MRGGREGGEGVKGVPTSMAKDAAAKTRNPESERAGFGGK